MLIAIYKTLHVLWTWSEHMHVVGYNPRIIFLSFFSQFELSYFFGHFSEWIKSTLCAQLLLQFHTHTLENFTDIVTML